MADKKPRKLAINIHINQGESIGGTWDEKEQRLSLRVLRDGKIVSARKIQLTAYYDRSKKPKILNQLEFRRSSEFTVSHDIAVTRYSQLWAIDTNRRELFGHIANVSGVTVCSTDGSNDYYPVLAIIFGKVFGNPELYAWRRFIEFVQTTPRYDAQHCYGLVVDSEFSLISSLNSRERAIHGHFVLPPNWTLIYATSDSGKEDILNRILAISDKMSTLVLDSIAGREANAKHWLPVTNEEQHQPTFVPVRRADC